MPFRRFPAPGETSDNSGTYSRPDADRLGKATNFGIKKLAAAT